MKHTIGKTMIKKRTVAYIDILGFKNILANHKLINVGNAFKSVIENLDRVLKDDSRFLCVQRNTNVKCPIFIFSDSIAIFSPDVVDSQLHETVDNWYGFLSVVLYAERTIQCLLSSRLPFRGGIAFGETYLDVKNSIFLGDGYMKAVALEKVQQWLGVSIDKSVEQEFSSFLKNKDLKCFPLIKYEVPLVCGHSEKKLTVNWLQYSNPNPDDGNFGYSELIAEIKKMINRIGADLGLEVEKKYKNTLEYINYVNFQLWYNSFFYHKY